MNGTPRMRTKFEASGVPCDVQRATTVVNIFLD